MAMPARAAERLPALRAPQAWSADLALLAITAIWGVTFSVVNGALADASPLSFNALRLSLAAVLLAAFYRPRWRALPLRVWAVGALLGLCLAVGYALQTAGLARTSPAASAFITGLMVIFVPLLLAAFWRRHLPPAAWVSTALALAGLWLLLGADFGGLSRSVASGDGLTALCAVAFAFQIILLSEWTPRLGFRDVTVVMILFSAIFTWLFLPAVEHPHWILTPRLWLALILTAVFATAVAFTVQSWAQQFTPSTHAAVIFAFEPVFAWLAALIGWHEALRPIQLAGAAVILAAMLVVEWRPARQP